MSDLGLSECNSLSILGEEQWNHLGLENSPIGLEKIIDYEQGGYHPVHLRDNLREGRYHVIHKLGNGGFANVWLCRDQNVQVETKYVAVKILMAEASTDECPELQVNKLKDLALDRELDAKYICLPLDQLKIDGPNGCHLCFVYPVLGPPVSSCVLNKFENSDKSLRKIALEVVQAMDFMHSNGICHGDYTPRNILLRIDGLNGLTEDEVIRTLGEPITNRVLADLENPIELGASKYLVYPVDWDSSPQLIKDQACIIDFGESFQVSDPPSDLGTPGPYRSPELILDKTAGSSSDIWALGCTIFTIRTGRKLFDLFDNDDDVYLDHMVQILGKLPEPWWSTTWEKRKEYLNVAPVRETMATEEETPSSQSSDSDSNSNLYKNSEDKKGMEATITTAPWVVENARSLQDMLAPGLWYTEGADGFPCVEIHRDISREEIEVFVDLLGKFLRLDPKERLAAGMVLDHEWFRM